MFVMLVKHDTLVKILYELSFQRKLKYQRIIFNNDVSHDATAKGIGKE